LKHTKLLLTRDRYEIDNQLIRGN